MADPAFWSASEQARRLAAGEVSSRELTAAYLERIEQLDGALNSYVTVLAERAMADAAARDEATARREATGLFHGVPISIKDLHLLAGSRTTFGTASMADHVATFDEEAVARLLAAGCVPLGKTNVSELGSTGHSATRLLGPSRNPWDLTRNAGGSSGGAGASLAAGLCAAAQGSDGGGSIRLPAAVNGVVGLKPSRDRVSNAPMVGDSLFGLTTRGMLTRTVEDAAAFLDVLAGYVAGDPGMAPPPDRRFRDEVGFPPGRLHIAVSEEHLEGSGPSPAVHAALVAARTLLEELGHTCVDVHLGLPATTVDRFLDVWAAGVGSQPFDPDTLEPLNRWLVEHSRRTSAADYVRAQFDLQLTARRLVERLLDYDALLTPTVMEPALRNDRYDDVGPEELFHDQVAWVGLTPLANVTGQPAISLPMAMDDATGLPIGVQLIGRPWDESGLLRLAAEIEAAAPWTDRRPPHV